MNGYLGKPFGSEELKQKLQELLTGSKVSPFSLGAEKLWFENRGNISWRLLCHTIMI